MLTRLHWAKDLLQENERKRQSTAGEAKRKERRYLKNKIHCFDAIMDQGRMSLRGREQRPGGWDSRLCAGLSLKRV